MGECVDGEEAVDGEPRFATCIAAGSVVFATLTRHNMVTIIMQRPTLGAKILIKPVSMLSRRLRQTSTGCWNTGKSEALRGTAPRWRGLCQRLT